MWEMKISAPILQMNERIMCCAIGKKQQNTTEKANTLVTVNLFRFFLFDTNQITLHHQFTIIFHRHQPNGKGKTQSRKFSVQMYSIKIILKKLYLTPLSRDLWKSTDKERNGNIANMLNRPLPASIPNIEENYIIKINIARQNICTHYFAFLRLCWAFVFFFCC